ncbi:hypothetical protein [Cellulomonas sp. KRMCY2]|uniref:hypothetical protein n=1 Tax=Cellulomonas sp. KRMCY2 TaxID=1304865 RepID=UPI00045EB03C|nr:hypothetical protein [Cellulomonas sp. KRMCY2]
MEKHVQALLDSMVAHDPGRLPLAARYAATEDSRPSALALMTAWRTVTAVRCLSQVVADDQAGTVVFAAAVEEAGSPTIVFGRIKVEAEVFTEIELYLDRSRADSGFVYLPDQMAELPEVWTREIDPSQRATREELVALGRAIYDTDGALEYETADQCVLLEIGGVVFEDAKYLAALQGREVPEDTEPSPVGGGLWPGRPVDPTGGQVLAVDVEHGVVVSRLTVDGYVCPYVVDHENSSCFVPEIMIDAHQRTLDIADLTGRSVLQQMPASATTYEMVRFFGGRVQGMHRYIQLQAAGGRSPWSRTQVR